MIAKNNIVQKRSYIAPECDYSYGELQFCLLVDSDGIDPGIDEPWIDV